MGRLTELPFRTWGGGRLLSALLRFLPFFLPSLCVDEICVTTRALYYNTPLSPQAKPVSYWRFREDLIWCHRRDIIFLSLYFDVHHVMVGPQGKDPLSTEARRNATFLFHAHLRATLASKRVLAEYRLDEQAFDWLVGEINNRFDRARPPPPSYSLCIRLLSHRVLLFAFLHRQSKHTRSYLRDCYVLRPATAALKGMSHPPCDSRTCFPVE